MKPQTVLIALVLPSSAAAFVVGPRARISKVRTNHGQSITAFTVLFEVLPTSHTYPPCSVSKRMAPRFAAEWGGDNVDFLNKIPDIPAAKKEQPKPKEPEPATPTPAPIPSATAPIGVSSSESTSPPPPEPVASPPPKTAVAPAPAPSAAASTSIELPGDLPIPIIAGGALAAFAAATFAMRGDVDEREAAQSGGGSSTSASAPATSSGGVDLSIPYDAAAKLAYEKSDKSMSYDKFQEKYEADAVADVKAKQKK